jgi:hypothetical protein
MQRKVRTASLSLSLCAASRCSPALSHSSRQRAACALLSGARAAPDAADVSSEFTTPSRAISPGTNNTTSFLHSRASSPFCQMIFCHRRAARCRGKLPFVKQQFAVAMYNVKRTRPKCDGHTLICFFCTSYSSRRLSHGV